MIIIFRARLLNVLLLLVATIALFPQSRIEAQDEDQLVRIDANPVLGVWDTNADKLHLGIYRDTNDPNQLEFITYDADARLLADRYLPSDRIDDKALKTQLKARSAIFPSPSGRYFVYVMETTNTVAVMDTQSDSNFISEVIVPALTPTDSPYFRFSWSPDETVLMINQPPDHVAQFVLFGGVVPIVKTYLTLKTDSGEDVMIDQVLSRLSASKMAMITGGVLGQPGKLWIFDIETGIASKIELDDALDATFSSDDRSILVIHAKGISRVSLDLSQIEEVSNEVTSQWSVCFARFSTSGKYIFLLSGTSEAHSEWIYTLPETLHN